MINWTWSVVVAMTAADVVLHNQILEPGKAMGQAY